MIMILTGLREERGYGSEDQYPMGYVHEHSDDVTQNNTVPCGFLCNLKDDETPRLICCRYGRDDSIDRPSHKRILSQILWHGTGKTVNCVG